VAPETSQPAVPTAEPVMVQRIDEALLLLTDHDDLAGCQDKLALLPAEQGRCHVLVSAEAGLALAFPQALIAGLAEPRGPVRLIMLGPFPSAAGPVEAAGYLAALLKVPVTVPETPVVPGVAPGPRWLTCEPGRDERREPRWPEAPPAVVLSEELLALFAARDWPHAAPVRAAKVPVAEPVIEPAVTQDNPVPVPEAEVPPAESARMPAEMWAVAARPRARPIWIDHQAWRDTDRAELRKQLTGRYDAHMRAVTKTLAEEPGLRTAGTSTDLVAGLVAVRAYCAGERADVNRLLRTGDGDERAAVVARGVAYGLRCLPTVLGPVFLPGHLGADALGAYQPGRVLTEPGLLDAQISPTGFPDATVQFVIWSVSARRLGRIGVDGPAAALFPPSTRFTVLAVDRDAKQVPRVLLSDVTAAARGGPVGGRSERALTRMRVPCPPTEVSRPEHLSASPGLDDTGHPYLEGTLDAS
jgi:hypothetical protein